jgi:Fe-S-cluster containining protein
LAAHPAGGFSAWLRAMRRSLAGGEGMPVACGDCVGCCTSGYFIKVRPHETAALRHIPSMHLAPGESDGTLYMAAKAGGHCPMFGRSGPQGFGCTIYPHRPETCRTYDCRIFTAAGTDAGEGKSMINERIASWQFEYEDDDARREHRAVRAAASFLRQHPVRFPGGHIPSRAGDIAVLAVKCYAVFMDESVPETELAPRIVAACREFDSAARVA